MKLEEVELSNTPESMQKRIKQKLKMYDGTGELLKITKTDHVFTAYLSAGNLCTILTVWNFNLDEVNEDSVTVGDMKQFIKHPSMQWWFRD